MFLLPCGFGTANTLRTTEEVRLRCEEPGVALFSLNPSSASDTISPAPPEFTMFSDQTFGRQTWPYLWSFILKYHWFNLICHLISHLASKCTNQAIFTLEIRCTLKIKLHCLLTIAIVANSNTNMNDVSYSCSSDICIKSPC